MSTQRKTGVQITQQDFLSKGNTKLGQKGGYSKEVFELDYRFRDDFPHYQQKVDLISRTYGIPIDFIWSEVEKLSDMQVPEKRIWDIIVSRVLTERSN